MFVGATNSYKPFTVMDLKLNRANCGKILPDSGSDGVGQFS